MSSPEVEPSDYTPSQLFDYVTHGLAQLKRALAPFVRDRLAGRTGDSGRSGATKTVASESGDAIDQDPYKLLVLIQRERETFSPSLRSDGMRWISSLKNARNQWAHFEEFDLEDTFHFHDCLCKLFNRLNYEAPEVEARKDSLQALLAQEVHPTAPQEARAEEVQPEPIPDAPPASTPDREPQLTAAPYKTSRAVPIIGGSVVGALAITGIFWFGGFQRDSNSNAPAGGEVLVSQPLQSGPATASRPPRAVSGDQQGASPASSPASVDEPPGVKSDLTTQPPSGTTSERTPVQSERDTAALPAAALPQPSRDQDDSATVRVTTPAPVTETLPAIDIPVEREPPNLITNGDFREHWAVGWNKQVDDPTQGSFVVENQNDMLHMTLEGENSAQVWQVVPLAEGRGLDDLMFEAGVKLTPKRAGMLGLAPPVEMALIVQFMDRQERDLGQIWYTQFATTGLEGSGLVGVPETLHATGQRCQVPLAEGFARIRETLGRKATDCLAMRPSDVASIMIVCWMRTGTPQSAAEAFLQRVRLYYR